MHRTISPLGRVLGDTIAEGPVLFLDLNEVNEDILAPEPDGRMKAVGDSLVERLLLRRGPTFVPGDLDKHEVFAALYTEIVRIELEAVGLVLNDDLEAILSRDANADKCVVDEAADLLAISRILAFSEIDTNERQCLFS